MTVFSNIIRIGYINPDWCKNKVERIIEQTDPILSGSSGKETRRFHKSSNSILVEEILELIYRKHKKFYDNYPSRILKLDFIDIIRYLGDYKVSFGKEVISEGVFVISVQGGSVIRFNQNGLDTTVRIEEGTVWYLNTQGNPYSVESIGTEPRIDIVLPNNVNPKTISKWKSLIDPLDSFSRTGEDDGLPNPKGVGLNPDCDLEPSSRRNILVSNPSLFPTENYLPYLWGSLRSYSENTYKRGKLLKKNFHWLDPIYDYGLSYDLLDPYGDTRIDVLGLSCYMWNWETNMDIAKLVKQKNPNCLVVAGGPQLDWKDSELMDKLEHVDIVVTKAGEHLFAEILNAVVNESTFNHIPNLILRTGRTKLDPTPLELSHWKSPFIQYREDYERFSNNIKSMGKTISVGWETDRGCPYSCSFCDWGSATNTKIKRHGRERILKEAEIFGEIGVDVVFNVNANFGIFQDDEQYVDKLIEVNSKTGYPKSFNFSSAKNNKKIVSRINEKLYRSGMIKMNQIAFQHTDDSVLDAIDRTNIPTESMFEEIKRNHEDNIPFVGVLISGNPGDTPTRWKKCFDDLLNWGFHESIKAHDFALLPNAPAADPHYMEKWGIEVVHRRYPDIRPSKTRPDANKNKTDFIVSTSSFTKSDWVDMKIYSEMVQGLHNMGLTRFPAQFAKEYHGVPYLEFYENLIYNVEEMSLPRTVLGTLFNSYLVDPDQELFLDYDEDFDQLVAPHEYVYLWSMERLDVLYRGVKKTMMGFGLGSTMVDSLLGFQRSILLTPDYSPSKGRDVEYNHNWPEIFHAMLVSPPMGKVRYPELLEKRGIFPIRQKTIGVGGERLLKPSTNIREMFDIIGVANFRHRTTYFYDSIKNYKEIPYGTI